MKTLVLSLISFSVLLQLGCVSGSSSDAESDQVFGSREDRDYARSVWRALQEVNLIGERAITTVPYKGQHPHGTVLETLYSELKVKGHRGKVIVKRNYSGEGITRSKVAKGRTKYLKAIDIMFQRENGYDAENQNWFWAKFTAAGELDKNSAGIGLAGRVAKGKKKGCIACHGGAPGGDYIFSNTAMQLDR